MVKLFYILLTCVLFGSILSNNDNLRILQTDAAYTNQESQCLWFLNSADLNNCNDYSLKFKCPKFYRGFLCCKKTALLQSSLDEICLKNTKAKKKI